MRPELSVIVPIKIQADSQFRLDRLKAILDAGQGLTSLEIVIIDSSSCTFAHRVHKLCQQGRAIYQNAQIRSPYSPGEARNLGVLLAQSDHLLFLDADLLVTRKFFEKMLALKAHMQDSGNLHQFYSIPCIYMNQSHHTPTKGLYEDAFSMALTATNSISHIAIATSTILLWKKHFTQLGGFSSAFVGYGCEDLELLHRLATFYPIGRRNADYDVDARSKSALLQSGYRKYFSYYCLPLLFDKIYTVHLWHERPLNRLYYRKRVENDKAFQAARRSFDKAQSDSVAKQASMDDLAPIVEFLRTQKGREISFNDDMKLEYKQAVVQRIAYRKLRKLILSPRLFFVDFLRKKNVAPQRQKN